MKKLKKYLLGLLISTIPFTGRIYSQNHQPEVASYENQITTDLVNLSTGDFNYNMPVLSIPSTHGMYDVNLIYHGGIKNSQQSTWVGLGWNINPGSVLRTLNGYADDYNGYDITNKLDNDGVQYHVYSWLVYTNTYNSLEGESHSLNLFGLTANWDDKGNYTVGSAGLYYGSEGIEVKPEETVFTAIEIAAAMASAGSSEIGASAAEAIAVVDKTVSTFQKLKGLAGMAQSISQFMNYSNNQYLWSESKSIRLFHKGIYSIEYDTHLNKKIINEVYGPLYLQNLAPELNASYPEVDCNTSLKDAGLGFDFSFNGTGINFHKFKELVDPNIYQKIHDVHMFIDPEASNYLYTKNPTKINYDSYMVQGGSVSGSIIPYRTEIGSVVADRWGYKDAEAYAINHFRDYKVGFRSINNLNYYGHHENSKPDILSGIEWDTDDSNNLLFKVQDANLICESETDRDGLKNGKLYGGNDIKWYSHDDILGNTDVNPQAEGFMDYVPLHHSSTLEFRKACAAAVDGKLDYSGIGGYMITGTDGTTYHYALPVYTNYQYTETISGPSEMATTSQNKNTNKFANNWLLTGITGSDYIDANGNNKIDEGDWGYWVKFEYVKHEENFEKRTPSAGYIVSPDENSKTYTLTKSQLYYLNFIKTNTHTALFTKSVKTGRDEGMKLNEIVLFDNITFQQFEMPGLLENLINPETYPLNDHNKNVFSKYERKVVFETNYELSKKDGSGLLTLKSVKTLYPGEQMLIPPFKFSYGSNPNFDENHWDAWGNYNPEGSNNSIDRLPSNLRKGDEWCLNSITSPIGTEIKIDYEKDDYDNVFGYTDEGLNLKNFGAVVKSSYWNGWPHSAVLYFKDGGLPDIVDNYEVGDMIYVRNARISKITFNPGEETVFFTGDFKGEIYEIDKEEGEIIFNLSWLPQDSQHDCTANAYSFDGISLFDDNDVRIGGDNRVSEISIEHKNNISTTKYIYTLNGSLDGKSSGFCLQEPAYCRTNIDFYDSKEFTIGSPNIPVMYSNVTVLENYVDQNNYTAKTVYEYELPKQNMFILTSNEIYDDKVNGNDNHIFKFMNYELNDYTSQVGRINSISKYNSPGDLLIRKSYNYTSDVINGKITHGTVLAESGEEGAVNYDRLLRTTIIEHPNVLESINIYTDRTNITEYYLSPDIVSNRYLKHEVVNNKTNDVITTEILPAYKAYANMGNKSVNSSYRNMLSQDAAKITKLNNNVLNTSIQTWKSDWNNYVEWDASGDASYTGEDALNDGSGVNIWRKHKSFVWKSPVDENGYYTNFENYDSPEELKDNFPGWADEAYTGTPENSNGWKLNNEIVRYSHYSTPVEAKDINGDYISSKTGPNHMYTTVSATNASYTSFAASSFEIEKSLNSGSAPYLYDGEIISSLETPAKISYDSDNYDANTMIPGVMAHTGNYFGVIPSGTVGFKYKGLHSVNSTLIRNSDYRASVWVHKNSPGISYLKANVDGTLTSSQKLVGVYGDWKLYYLDFNVPANAQSFTVYVEASGNEVYVDDFRVSPFEAVVNSYTYDNAGLVTAIINNDNFATKYEYDPAGRLIATYRETPKGFVKTSGHEYRYAGGYGISVGNTLIPSTGGAVSFNITNPNNDELLCEINAGWLNVQSQSSNIVVLSAPAYNSCDDYRSCQATITNKVTGESKTYTVRQEGLKISLQEYHHGTNFPSTGEPGDVIMPIVRVLKNGGEPAFSEVEFIFSTDPYGNNPIVTSTEAVVFTSSNYVDISTSLQIPSGYDGHGSHYLIIRTCSGEELAGINTMYIDNPPPYQFTVSVSKSAPGTGHYTLSANPDPSTGPYTYSWNLGQGITTPVVGTPTSKGVECSGYGTFSVTVTYTGTQYASTSVTYNGEINSDGVLLLPFD